MELYGESRVNSVEKHVPNVSGCSLQLHSGPAVSELID